MEKTATLAGLTIKDFLTTLAAGKIDSVVVEPAKGRVQKGHTLFFFDL